MVERQKMSETRGAIGASVGSMEGGGGGSVRCGVDTWHWQVMR